MAPKVIGSLWFACQAFTLFFIRLPTWVVVSIPTSNRPRLSWPLGRVVWVNILKATLRFGDDEPVKPNYTTMGKGAGINGVWVPPAPELVRGDVELWAKEQGVVGERIPGYWLDKDGVSIPADTKPKPGAKVLYYLHGGGYTKLSAHPKEVAANIPRGIIQHAGSVERAFALEYRLASSRGHPFPTALVDALAGYHHLVHAAGYAPEHIVVAGDSAGGNLTLALVRYLLERVAAGDADVPRPPGALVLLSPWADIRIQTYAPESSAYKNRPSDYVDLTWDDTVRATGFFLGKLSETSIAAASRYIAPASTSPAQEKVSFAGFPRALIVAGGAETLHDQIHTLRAKMETDMGEENVAYAEFEDAIHDFLLFTWHEPERTEALRHIGAWLDGLKA